MNESQISKKSHVSQFINDPNYKFKFETLGGDASLLHLASLIDRGIKRKLVDEFGARVAQITEERRSIASKQPVIGSEAAATALFYMVNRLEVTPADAVDLLNEKIAYYGDLKVVERFQTNSSYYVLSKEIVSDAEEKLFGDSRLSTQRKIEMVKLLLADI